MKAIRLALELLRTAEKNEPDITADVLEIAALVKAKVVGLENKFKSKESLARKLQDYSRQKVLPISVIAKFNNDALRYTYIFPDSVYAESLELVKEFFIHKGYKFGRIFNGWNLANTKNDIGYRGINLTIISSQKQKIELQLHTKASFQLKTETHDFYEEVRDIKVSPERKEELVNLMVEKAGKLVTPKGI
jgi:hypothetical protein